MRSQIVPVSVLTIDTSGGDSPSVTAHYGFTWTSCCGRKRRDSWERPKAKR